MAPAGLIFMIRLFVHMLFQMKPLLSIPSPYDCGTKMHMALGPAGS
jgi:hypothetical protein